MPEKMARSTPRPSFGLRQLLVASHISRLASRDAAKSLLSTLVSESSGECRLNWPASLANWMEFTTGTGVFCVQLYPIARWLESAINQYKTTRRYRR
jgi:hypothetical protein